jgi:8-oxo-dGTP pyrophosphatase MutT (NUDIX family)
MDDPVTIDVLRDALVAPPRSVEIPGALAAAVIVLVRFERGAEALAVVRASSLRDHAGEVGFPGGKPDALDPDLRATALRELEEEIGVRADDVEILGALTPVPVIDRRFVIHAFVARLAPDISFRVAAAEVSEIVALPLHALVTGARPHAAVHATWRGAARVASHFWIEPNDRVAGDTRAERVSLYGASAYIFKDLLERIAATLGVSMAAPVREEQLPWGDRYRRFE